MYINIKIIYWIKPKVNNNYIYKKGLWKFLLFILNLLKNVNYELLILENNFIYYILYKLWKKILILILENNLIIVYYYWIY